MGILGTFLRGVVAGMVDLGVFRGLSAPTAMVKRGAFSPQLGVARVREALAL